MSKYYAIMLNYKTSPTIPTKAIEDVLTPLVTDWLRYAGNQYIVQYAGDPPNLYAALKPVLMDGDNIVVIEVDISRRWGWASNVVVDWLTKHPS